MVNNEDYQYEKEYKHASGAILIWNTIWWGIEDMGRFKKRILTYKHSKLSNKIKEINGL